MPTLDLHLTSDEIAFQDAVTRLCAQTLGEDAQARRSASFSPDVWRQLAQVGLWHAAVSDEGGGMGLSCAAAEALGQAGFPGPVPHAIAVANLVADTDALFDGAVVATMGAGHVAAWAEVATHVFLVENGGIYSARVLEPIATLGRTSAARVIGSGDRRTDAGSVTARFDMALAAYTAGAARTLILEAAEHARTRRQFGKTLGEFQAVSFPLAEALMGVDGAQALARAAAYALDAKRPEAFDLARAARISAGRAAARTTYTAHQTYGAYGVIDDGPVAWLSRRLQDYAVLGPDQRSARRDMDLTIAAALAIDRWVMQGEHAC